MLIDTSYFEGELSLGQITSPAVVASVNLFIEKYEEELLTLLLGYPLYKVFIAGIALTAPEQRFKDLRDGAEYTYNTFLTKWRGLIFTTGTNKRSPIANYVYFKYIKDSVSFTMGAGEVKPAGKGDVNVSPNLKMVRAWNEMVRMNQELNQFMYMNQATYPEYIVSNFTGINFFTGLNASRIHLLKFINQFGI